MGELQTTYFLVREYVPEVVAVPVRLGVDEVVERRVEVVQGVTKNERDFIGDLFNIVDPVDVIRSIRFQLTPYAEGVRFQEPLNGLIQTFDVSPTTAEFEASVA